MFVQKRKEQLKEFEKQEKKLKEMKASGKSTKQAVSDWGCHVYWLVVLLGLVLAGVTGAVMYIDW